MEEGPKGGPRKDDDDNESDDVRGGIAPKHYPQKNGSKRKIRMDRRTSYPVPPSNSQQEKPKIITKGNVEDDGASGRPQLSTVNPAPSRKAKGKARAIAPPTSDIEETGTTLASYTLLHTNHQDFTEHASHAAILNSHTSGYDHALERRALRRAAKQSSQPGPSQLSAPSTSQRADEVQTTTDTTESPPSFITSHDAARGERSKSRQSMPMF
jgi:hypothetical protein